MKRGLARGLGVALVLASVAFLVRVVLRDGSTVQATPWRFEPAWLLLALVTQVGVLALGMFGWSRVLRLTEAKTPGFLVLWRLWSLASLARFIPGAVWQFVAADRLAANDGVERRAWSQTLALHMGFSLAGAAVVATFALPAAWWWLALAPVACSLPLVVRPALSLFARLTRQEALSWRAGPAHSLALLALAAAGWLASGFGFVALLRGLGHDGIPTLVALGANAGSWVVGVLVVFAPSGLGVREVITTFSLAPWVGEGDGVVLAAAARLWSLAAELLAAGLAMALVKWRRR